MQNSSINKRIVVNSFVWKIGERVFAQGIEFVVQVILARILLPADFASLALIVAITNYAAIFVQSGLATSIVQKDGLDELDISTLMTSSLIIALLFYGILFLAAPFVADYYNIPELKTPLRVLGLILFLNAINSIQIAILQRNMQFKKLFIRNMIAVPIAGVISVIMALLGCGIWALIAHNLISMLVLIFVTSIGTNFKFDFHFSWNRAKTLYSFGGKILIASLISGLYDTTRTAVIGRKYSANDLAYYDKAYTYSYYGVKLIGQSIGSVILPVFSKQQNQVETLKQTMRKTMQITAFAIFPAFLGIIAVAKPLVLFLLTEKWAECIPYLMLFCILRLSECIITIDKQAYYALGKSGICLFYEIGLCVFNMIVLIATLKTGVLGIAIGATLVQLLAVLSVCVISSKLYGYTLKERLKDIYKPTFNSILMSGAVYLIGFLNMPNWLSLIVQLTIGVALYLALAKITRDKNLSQITETIKSFIKKRTKEQ